MTECETAWVAGIIEGEGSFIRVGRKGNAVRVKVSMRDQDIIHRLLTITQVGNVCFDKQGMWTWYVERRDEVPGLVEALKPWMGERRLARIADVMSTFVDYGWDGTGRSHQNRPDRLRT